MILAGLTLVWVDPPSLFSLIKFGLSRTGKLYIPLRLYCAYIVSNAIGY